jgi:alcohol oxidase
MQSNAELRSKTGHRQDAAHRYIHPQANNKSLHVMTKTKVVRVLFDGTKATGVEIVANKDQVQDADQTPRTIVARKLVVVSAGAIGSPIILQHSGIGHSGRLTDLGIHVVADLPDVGRHYEDHSSLLSTFHVSDDTETMDCLVNKEPGFMERYIPEFANGKGFLTTNANDAGSKLRPTPEELKEMGPAFQEVWKRYFERAPDKVRRFPHAAIYTQPSYSSL